jgi:N-acylglucosamine-6-phosphate 2-epimerase
LNRKNQLTALKGKLIVSCQAYEGEPLYGADIMARIALAAKNGGAAAIRANSPEDIRAIKALSGLPVIGIWKKRYPDSEVYITPALDDAIAVAEAGADIIAMDATDRKRPGGERLETIVENVRKRFGGLLMADISTADEAVRAERLGFDIVSTTLSGYTAYSPKLSGPDFGLIADIVKRTSIPVFAEGRIRTPEEAARCLREGAFAVVVGSAITRPEEIAKRFAEAVRESSADPA